MAIVLRFSDPGKRWARCYGGVAHGQYAHPDEIRIHAAPRDRLDSLRGIDRSVIDEFRRMRSQQSYTREEFFESCESRCRRYQAERRIVCFIIDGGELSPMERYELRCDFDRIPWELVVAPSIIDDFDEWWRCACYRLRVHEGKARIADAEGIWWDQ